MGEADLVDDVKRRRVEGMEAIGARENPRAPTSEAMGCAQSSTVPLVSAKVAEDWGSQEPEVSVLVPCKNAMPWLGLAIRSALLQRGLVTEVLVVDDCSDDGSGEWLDALAAALGPERARVERADAASAGEGERNLAVLIPRRPTAATPNFGAAVTAGAPAAAMSCAPAGADASAAAAPRDQPLGADAVAAEVLVSEARSYLRVLSNRGHGQGAALQTALDACRAPLVAHIEADDEYGPTRLLAMREALRGASPAVDAVFSATELIGSHVTSGMSSYVGWQNGLLSSEAMAAGRFVELPSLHQVGLYTAASLRASAERMPGSREGERRLVYRELAEWPVDYDFALRWFAAGHRALKLPPTAAGCAYRWRQHGSNGTRWQGRCSLEALRACKAHYFARALREAGAPLFVQLWSVGRTLESWAAALAAVGLRVAQAIEWNPKQRAPAELGLGAGGGKGGGGKGGGGGSKGGRRVDGRVVPADTCEGVASVRGADDAAAEGGTSGGGGDGSRGFVRLFVYGSAPIRMRVSHALEGRWDPQLDFFAA